MKKSILFIINPVSGTQRKKKLPQLIDELLDKTKLDHEIVYTQRPYHATEIAKDAAKENKDIVVAVGGDGTINETAQGLIHTQTALAIIPMGSGNGLARHLGIPINTKKAILLINKLHQEKIDTCLLNQEKLFLCTSGVGFDAFIAKKFADAPGRGFMTYLKEGFKAFKNYKIQEYTIDINGEKLERKAWIVTAANAGQYGNNAHIAPLADIQDGKIDLCVLKPHPFIASLGLFWRLFAKNIHKSRHLETWQASEFVISPRQIAPIHRDGEPEQGSKHLHYQVLPQSLGVIVGK